MGRGTRCSSEEKRHTRGHGIPVGVHKRRDGHAAAAAQGFQTRRTGRVSGGQRDSGVAPARGFDLSNIAESRQQAGDPEGAEQQRPGGDRAILPDKSENVGEQAAESGVVDRRAEHRRRLVFDAAGASEFDEHVHGEGRVDDVVVEGKRDEQLDELERSQPAESDRRQRDVHRRSHAVQGQGGALRQRWRDGRLPTAELRRSFV